jgi:hypothetical protein
MAQTKADQKAAGQKAAATRACHRRRAGVSRGSRW